MLPKNYRLRLKKDFDAVFKGGRFSGQSFLTLGYLKNNLPVSRFAVIVGKKVSKKAVVRNLVKRRTIEIIRLNIDKIKQGFDLVFVAKPEIKGKKQKEIEIVVYELIQRSRLLTDINSKAKPES